MNLDPKTLGDVLRSILTFVGGFLVSRGILDEATMVTVAGAIAAMLVALWPVFFGKPTPPPPPEPPPA